MCPQLRQNKVKCIKLSQQRGLTGGGGRNTCTTCLWITYVCVCKLRKIFTHEWVTCNTELKQKVARNKKHPVPLYIAWESLFKTKFPDRSFRSETTLFLNETSCSKSIWTGCCTVRKGHLLTCPNDTQHSVWNSVQNNENKFSIGPTHL
jgi:hypothetical protein